ncbi:glycoside hydrolase family 2 TIM barrel-domain containing protein [Oribacterium sp. WCC10]|uniref:glycoside hydrolase family 2 TIM barrel-domain containing protein n=1 Tax=Oribacterium sp. WCC10 TaxID=1855343 RepID=UPI0008EA1F8B|nr:glycoside hydrolase family 2 TIM barrel-domain containing protein [Oribacterium sp. WCC10]SFG38402.1 beta-galactosidase [Oribacterium sp. WCC10]
MEKFDYSIVKDPKIFKINVLPQLSDHIAYRNEEELMTGNSGLRFSLNGLWKFSYAKNYRSTIPGFYEEGYDAEDWEDIRVPAHIQMEGYDIPAYVNTQYPWDGREQIEPGEIPESFNPVGSYVKYFTVPENFKNKPLYISFQGVESGFALWMNGQFVGYSEDSFTPSDFLLTPYVKAGVNKLSVQVFKWTASSWLEDQDFYRFSGIFRDVYLYTVPEVHVYDLKVKASLDKTLKDGTLEVTLDLGKAGGSTEYALSYGDDVVLSGEVKNATGSLRITGNVDSPELWSAEAPNLYRLRLTLKNDGGVVTEVIEQVVGFRRFEMDNGIMKINGKRIVFNGVNRHEFYTDKGRAAVTLEDVREDVIAMKRNNINAVRTSHYQNAPYIYRLCDEYGLYMIAENNMETHGVWDMIARGQKPLEYALPGNREEYIPMLMDRINSTYQLDKNHPSVIIWSIGNESFGGRVPLMMSDKFRELDPDRLVHYEGVDHDDRYPDTTDMYSQMYTPAAKIEEYLKIHTDKPFILCEYTHSMGNSNGGMFKYTDLADREARYQGGFIWDYVDQSLRRKNRFGEEYQAYGGDCGERPTDYEFSGNGIMDGNRQEYAGKMQEVKYCFQGLRIRVEDGKINIFNRNLFTASSEWRCIVSLKKQGTELKRQELETDVEPLAERNYQVPFDMPDEPGEYTIDVSFRLRENTSWAKKGHEVAYAQGIVKVGESQLKVMHEESMKKPFKVIRGSVNVGVKGENFDILISTLRGGITSYRYGGKELVGAVPRPNFWRAPTANDEGNQMAGRYGIWKLASLYQTTAPQEARFDDGWMKEAMKYPEVSEYEDHVDVCFKHWLFPSDKSVFATVTYSVYGDGTCRVTMDYKPEKELPPMPEFGFMMKLDSDFDRIKFYGYGPEENYCDRNAGARLGIYETTARDSMAPYLVPQETGNHTGVRWALVTDRRGRGMRFRCFSSEGMDFSAIPYTPEQLEEARHWHELPRVENTVVRCSMKQMGIAGDDSWGARTHEEFLVDNKNSLKFSFEFKGV